MDQYEFNQRLATAAREMAEEPDTQNTLERAVQMATEMVEHCDLAGISLVHPDGRIDTPAASEEKLRLVDELQYRLEEGPCRDALRQEDVVTVVNLSEDTRFPRWGSRIADEVGVHSSMSFRLFTTRDNMGALNLYARLADAFTHEDLLDGLIVAAHAAVAVAGTLQTDQLRRAMETRRTIGIAIGIIIERFGLDTDQAFGVLQRFSAQHNVKLHVVAQQLVDTGRLPGRGESITSP